MLIHIHQQHVVTVSTDIRVMSSDVFSGGSKVSAYSRGEGEQQNRPEF